MDKNIKSKIIKLVILNIFGYFFAAIVSYFLFSKYGDFQNKNEIINTSLLVGLSPVIGTIAIIIYNIIYKIKHNKDSIFKS